MLRSDEKANAGAGVGKRVPKSLTGKKRVQDPSVVHVAFTGKEDPGK